MKSKTNSLNADVADAADAYVILKFSSSALPPTFLPPGSDFSVAITR